MTEAARTILLAFAIIAAGFTWLAYRTSSIPPASPDRLIAELRLAQFASLLLAFTAGAYIGIAVTYEGRVGIGLDVALAMGFFVVGASTLIRDPRQALTMLALAFAVHAVVDVAHRPGLLPDAVAPRWFLIGCAVHDVYIGALCYLPILRR